MLIDVSGNYSLPQFANILQVKVQTAALRAVGNIVTGTDDQTQTVLNQVCWKYLKYCDFI